MFLVAVAVAVVERSMVLPGTWRGWVAGLAREKVGLDTVEAADGHHVPAATIPVPGY